MGPSQPGDATAAGGAVALSRGILSGSARALAPFVALLALRPLGQQPVFLMMLEFAKSGAEPRASVYFVRCFAGLFLVDTRNALDFVARRWSRALGCAASDRSGF